MVRAVLGVEISKIKGGGKLSFPHCHWSSATENGTGILWDCPMATNLVPEITEKETSQCRFSKQLETYWQAWLKSENQYLHFLEWSWRNSAPVQGKIAGDLEVTVYDSLKYWHKLIENVKPNEPWVDNYSTELLDGPVLMHELENAQLNSSFLRLSVFLNATWVNSCEN